jgi:hypothetical protein
MDTGHCPRCDAVTVVAGRIDTEGATSRFEPDGMRFFNLRLRAVACFEPFRACLMCGHVWSHLRPEDLRRYIDKYGRAKTKLVLSPFRKAPPGPELS